MTKPSWTPNPFVLVRFYFETGSKSANIFPLTPLQFARSKHIFDGLTFNVTCCFLTVSIKRFVLVFHSLAFFQSATDGNAAELLFIACLASQHNPGTTVFLLDAVLSLDKRS